ncbi:flagellar protein FlgN [Xanthomonas campestris pv. phormiicola]|nr:flagellar protein FlgN [Xanthomonas campestris pv. phormiicola]UYC17863.1 flagellar protein FlgN [Xanthomonas campestris pv. phormiicola]
MLQASVLARVIGELDQEVLLYRKLADLLEQQYRAAATADDRSLKQLCEALTMQLEAIEARHRARNPSLLGLIALLARQGEDTAPTAPTLQARCRELKQLALTCKSLCMRNGERLAAHYDSLHQALHGERHTYAPT